jgi:hypothetical protein
MIRTFKISESQIGKTLTIRFIPNVNDIMNNIVKINPSGLDGGERYLCYAVVNGTFKLFNFGRGVYNAIGDNMFLLEFKKALKVVVGETMEENVFEVVEDDVFAIRSVRDRNEVINKIGDGQITDFIDREMKRK